MSDTTRFIIKLQVARRSSPKRCAEFYRSDEHDAHIYQGREYPLSELNTVYPLVVEKYRDYEYLPPIPWILEDAEPAPIRKSPTKKAPAARRAPATKKLATAIR